MFCWALQYSLGLECQTLTPPFFNRLKGPKLKILQENNSRYTKTHIHEFFY